MINQETKEYIKELELEINRLNKELEMNINRISLAYTVSIKTRIDSYMKVIEKLNELIQKTQKTNLKRRKNMTYVCEFGWWEEDRDIILVTDNIGKAVRDCLRCGYENEDFETITIQVWDRNERLVEYGPVQSLIREDCPNPQEVIAELQEYIDLAIERRIWQNAGEQIEL